MKKETLYNNNITSLEEYQKLVEEWIEFYNTTRIKGKKIIRRKDTINMINKDELIYKMETVIEYLKNNNGYNYKLYDLLWPDYGKPDSNIVEYAKDILDIINKLINVIDNK